MDASLRQDFEIHEEVDSRRLTEIWADDCGAMELTYPLVMSRVCELVMPWPSRFIVDDFPNRMVNLSIEFSVNVDQAGIGRVGHMFTYPRGAKNSRQVQLLPSAEIPRQALVILQEALLCHPGAREAAGKIPGPNRSNIWKQNLRKKPCLNNLCSGFSARTDIFYGVVAFYIFNDSRSLLKMYLFFTWGCQQNGFNGGCEHCFPQVVPAEDLRKASESASAAVRTKKTATYLWSACTDNDLWLQINGYHRDCQILVWLIYIYIMIYNLVNCRTLILGYDATVVTLPCDTCWHEKPQVSGFFCDWLIDCIWDLKRILKKDLNWKSNILIYIYIEISHRIYVCYIW